MISSRWTLLLALGWGAIASAGPTPVTAEGIATASCFGWHTESDSAFVARQKETCTPEAGCTLGAYVAKVGTTGGARTVAHVGLAKDAAGHVGVAALILSAKPKFLEKANTVLNAEADAACETYADGVTFQLGGKAASVGVVSGVVTVSVGGRAVPLDTLSTGAVAETLEAVHLRPGGTSVVIRIVSRSAGVQDVRFLHVGAGKLGLTPATTPVSRATPEAAPTLSAPTRLSRWPTTGPSCLGWSADGGRVYVLRDRIACGDDQTCQVSTALVEVGRDGAKALKPVVLAEGPFQNAVAAARAPLPAGRLEAVNALVVAQLGCASGRTGALPSGRRFTVRSAEQGPERPIWVRVDDGAETEVGVLTHREGTEDAFGDVTPERFEEVIGVYGHPQVAAIVIEVRRRSGQNLDSRFIRVDGPTLEPKVAAVPFTETAEDALRKPRTVVEAPFTGRRCLGWSRSDGAAYVVTRKSYCIDAGGMDCSASMGVTRVDLKGARAVATFGQASGSSDTVDARLERAMTPESLAKAMATFEGRMDVGCAVGLTGTAGGAQFVVEEVGRDVNVAVNGGDPTRVVTLPKSHAGEESGHYADYSVSAVYSHPDVPVIVIEVQEETDRGTSFTFRAVRISP